VDTAQLERSLADAVDGEVRFDTGSRAVYAQEGGNYRMPPIGVVIPRSRDAAVAAISVCASMGAPVLSRGGGTSLAGQCCNEAVVIDWTKYCHRVVSADPERRTVTVEPGIALDKLNDAMREHGLMVGPRPSTHVSCTIGGMIGNNSCGSMAQAFGKMEDSVVRLEICTYDGLRTWTGATSDEEFAQIIAEGGRKAEIYRRLRGLRDACMGEIRAGFPKIPRRVSGYNLDHLLPEKDFNVARALVGSESTLVTVLTAEIALVEIPKYRSLVILGYPNIVEAAGVVPLVNEHSPLAAEGLDDTLVELEKEEHFSADALSKLPSGAGWMMVQFGGETCEEAEGKSRHFIDDCLAEGDHPKPRVAYLEDPRVEDELWEVREASLGATAYPPHKHITHEGWEDAAVPPDRLAAYLAAFERLLKRFHYESASLYGHFGQGCVHTRIPFDLGTDEGVATYREFVSHAADLVVSFGGSLSGEHGDGQSRGELLPKMFSPPLIRAFEELKSIFDPDDKMNPGKVVHPRRLDDNLTLHNWSPSEPRTFFHYPEDGFKFSRAASRCVGTGHCRSDEGGGVMCPSYRVTREEEDCTRGRARLLEEMVRGDMVSDGWHSEAVHDALDLCLACKSCRKECPVGVDMATYKAEFLAHHYARRLRPASHYSMGWLPLLSRVVTAVPGVAGALNGILSVPAVATVAKRAGGIAPEREIPTFATESFTQWFRRRGHGVKGGRRVVLWPDSFSNYFHPEVAQAAVRVLESAGFTVSVPSRPVCCGLTWITTGQLGTASRLLRRSIQTLLPDLRADVPVVVLEPSCAAVFRSDASELLGTDYAQMLASQTKTLAEILTEADWPGPSGAPGGGAQAAAGASAVPHKAVAQVHCHQHAILGFDADMQLLQKCGVDVQVLDSSCCGLAGNFGFERGHYEVSAALAERGLWPAARNAEPGSVILADGFSCRTQLAAAKTDTEGLHLAQLLDRLRSSAVG
jgi:FAD/FMN-containing dehydrogenase/Fe-S oxidoreductase